MARVNIPAVGRKLVACCALMLAVPASANATTPPTEPVTTTTAPAEPSTTTPAAATSTTTPATSSTSSSTTSAPVDSSEPPVETSEAPETTVGAPPTIAIDKTNTVGGETEEDRGVVEPGGSFGYRFVSTCSSGGQGCVNLTITDIFPAEVVVDEDTLPRDIDGVRDVTWVAESRTLTVIYTTPLVDPSGQLGMAAGGSDDFTVDVTLPTDTTLSDGAVIINEASIAAGNAGSPPADPTSVTVNIPPVETSEPVVETTEVTETTEGGPVIFLTPDPTNTIAVDKRNTADGEPAGDGGTVEPGDPYTYNFLVSCSNINVDCVNLTFVDTFPADVIVDESTIPPALPGFRTVSYDAGTQTLTVVYIEPLANPPATTGKIAGTSDSFNVSVTFPTDTPLNTGDVIPNEATVSADNVAASATDPSDVVVNIPRVVDVGTSKSFEPQFALAGDPLAAPIIHLAADNLSSNSAEVTEMTIEDSTPETWEYLDFTSATVTQYPVGAAQAQLYVCPALAAPCAEAEWVAGGTGTPPAPSVLTLPGSVPASDVVGVRVVFTAADGSFIENEPNGGSAAVDIQTDLRETVRSTDQVIEEIPATTVIDNEVTSTVTDPEAGLSTATGGAQFQILPPTLNLTTSKSFFPDENGNYQTDSGEHAVIGENSGVSMLINAQNTSAFPIAEIVITEPAPPPPASEFDKFDATSIRLAFPAGAATANVVVAYDDGTSTTTTYDAPGPGDVALGDPPPRVTSITVTYAGPDENGDSEPDPTITAGTTAGLGVHGNLNDNVDGSDIGGGGVVAGVDNCAHFTGSGGGIPGGTGEFTGTSCDQLPIEDRDAGTGGTKTQSQNQIPLGQPVLFTMTTTNNGNLPLIDLTVWDPPPVDGGVPPTPDENSLFYWGEFLGADVQPASMAGRVTIQVYTPDTGVWRNLTAVDAAEYPEVIGVRASIDVLNPTESFSLRIGGTSRDPLPPGDPPDSFTNCYAVTAAGGEYEAQTYCGPPLDPAPLDESAVINKAITPQSMPRRIPGMTPQTATVQLLIRNTGDITARTLQLIDNDADFWDAVDFVSLVSITAPAVGTLRDADRIQIDAFVGGAWVNGTPAAIGSAALPGGVTPAQVRGLRFTFSDTSPLNDGFVLTPCDDTPCSGLVNFRVVPRLSLLSTGEPLPDQLLDSATGAFTTRLHPDPDDPATIAEVTDDLNFVPGAPRLDVNKGPENTTVQPGQLATFTLVTRNNGTANLPDVTVSDPLPDGILFDGNYADPATGRPFTVTWLNLPAGYPAPPAATFVPEPDPDDATRVGRLRWTFAGWAMPPNSTVTIVYRYTLEPGVTAGQVITNTMGASSPVANLACTPPDAVVTDGAFGAGTYCTDPANVTVTAGANFVSRKWVAGNPDLGWYNVLTGERVDIGGSSCLALSANGRTYTTNPCIALVNPGEEFHYVLRVQNAGTESALEMTIIDSFPAPDDTGVFGADRGTQWDTAPTLAGPATYNGPATGTIEYSTSSTPCPGGAASWPCDGTGWTADAAGASSLRMVADFDPLLPPGGTVDIYFSMTTPVEVPWVADPTIAWNSLAHGEVTQPAPGQERELSPLEPLKVGVATMYGDLEVIKEIGDNPADLPLDDLEFTFAYDCTLTNGLPAASGTVTATATTPGVVEHIAAGATCDVWETETNGGIPDATEGDPVEVVIVPSLDPEDPVISSVTIINDFPLGFFEILKQVTGGADPAFTGGPYLVEVDCSFADVQLPGFPIQVQLEPDVAVGAEAPIGTVCTVVETDSAGAATVTYDPPAADGEGAEGQVPADGDLSITVTITNDFAVGSLVIIKEVSGPGVPGFSTGPFVFDVTCDYLENEDVFSTTVTVPGSSDGTPVESDPVTGLPVGAICTVTEVDSAGADIVSPPQTVTIEENEEANVSFVGVNNPFSAGTISVAKLVDGDAADSAYVDGLSFTVAVECAVAGPDGAPETVFEGDVTVAGDGEPVPATEADGTPVLLPLGARCWGVENDSAGATEVVVDHDSFANGVEVVADADAAVQELLITVTNTFDPAVLVVSKAVVNPPDANATYTFTITCTIENADGTVIDVPVLSGESPFTLGPNDSASFDVLVGSQCTVIETSIPAGAVVTFAEVGGVADVDPADGVIRLGEPASLEVTNTFPPAEVLPATA